MEDIDLERIGTRPRRKQSKQYSFYPPSSESKSDKGHVKQLFQTRFFLLFACCISILFLFLNYHSSIITAHESLHFNDSSQYTDYTLLEQLLIGDSSSSSATLPHIQSSFIQQLARDTTIQGNTLDELRRLPRAAFIPSVTVIIQTHALLPQQIQAVLSQTVVPDLIWIVGDNAQQAQSLQDGKRVRWVEQSDVAKAVSEVQTDYAWVLDVEVLPGKRYLEYLLRVGSMPAYGSSLLGTEAVQEDSECIWTDKSRVVKEIRDSWLLKKSWIKYWQKETSRSLYEHAGILSVLLPSDEGDQSYWGNTKRKTSCTKAAAGWKTRIPENAILIYVHTKEMQKVACDFMKKGQEMVVVSEKKFEQCSTGPAPLFKTSNTEDVIRIVDLMQPKVILSDTKMNLLNNIPFIHLTKRDISRASWFTDLPIDLLAEWNSISIKIMVNVDKKHNNFERFLASLDKAYFMGDSVDLTLLMDYTTDHTIHQMASHYHWTHGHKYLRHRIAVAPKMARFAEAWYPSSNDEYAIMLDTELELSPHFYSWAKYATLSYRRSSKHLFGISLYRPELIETDPSGRRLFNERPKGSFLMQWPSHSGALFFPEHWREFHDYATTRLADREGFRLQEINVPESRSNEWKLSWRRYFEELAYLRPYVMFYPPVSLSTRHVELRKKAQKEKYKDALSLYHVPLMKQMPSMPAWEDLPMIDFYGQPTTMEIMKSRGAELQDSISSCLPNPEIDFDPSDLLCPFSRIVSVTVENENDPVEELPVKQVNVYV
ncbi:hypothetical protein G6F43_005671 [Rhizopus delemar]|nr:hypothetical protein G6F43_005671 [Rhizopus delemar]